MTFTELPPDNLYPGLTRLEVDGRTIVAIGTGEAVRQALREKAAQNKCGTMG